MADYEDTVLTVDGKSYADFSYTTTYGGNRLKTRQNLLLNRGTEITVTYTDLAARWQANTEFVSIHASMQLD